VPGFGRRLEVLKDALGLGKNAPAVLGSLHPPFLTRLSRSWELNSAKLILRSYSLMPLTALGLPALPFRGQVSPLAAGLICIGSLKFRGMILMLKMMRGHTPRLGSKVFAFSLGPGSFNCARVGGKLLAQIYV
jgi:hypothetical protein